MMKARGIIITCVGVVLLLAWEAVSRRHFIPRYMLPAPSDIAKALFLQRNALAYDILVTSVEAVTGLVIALAVACITGTVSYFSPSFRRVALSAAVAVKSVPIIVFAPLLLIWTGYGLTGKILLAAIVAYFPVAIAM